MLSKIWLRTKSRKLYIVKMVIIFQLILATLIISGLISDLNTPANLSNNLNLITNNENHSTSQFIFSIDSNKQNDLFLFNIKNTIQSNLQKEFDKNVQVRNYSVVEDLSIPDKKQGDVYLFIIADNFTYNNFVSAIYGNSFSYNYSALIIPHSDRPFKGNYISIKPSLNNAYEYNLTHISLIPFDQIQNIKNPIPQEIQLDGYGVNFIVFNPRNFNSLGKLFSLAEPSQKFSYFIDIDQKSFDTIALKGDINNKLSKFENDLSQTLNNYSDQGLVVNHIYGTIITISSSVDPIRSEITLNYLFLVSISLFLIIYMFLKLSNESFWKRIHLEDDFIEAENKLLNRVFMYIVESIFFTFITFTLFKINYEIVILIYNVFFNIKSDFSNSNNLFYASLIFVGYFGLNIFFDLRSNIDKISRFNFSSLNFQDKYIKIQNSNFALKIPYIILILLIIYVTLFLHNLNSLNYLIILWTLVIFIMLLSEAFLKSFYSFFRFINKKLHIFINFFDEYNKKILYQIWKKNITFKIKTFTIFFSLIISLLFVQSILINQTNYSSIYQNNTNNFYLDYTGQFNDSLIKILDRNSQISAIQVTLTSNSYLGTKNNSNFNDANFVGLDLKEFGNFYNSKPLTQFISNFYQVENNFTGIILPNSYKNYYKIGDSFSIFYYNSTNKSFNNVELRIQGFLTNNNVFNYGGSVILPLNILRRLTTVSNSLTEIRINIRPLHDIYKTYEALKTQINNNIIYVNLANELILTYILVKSIYLFLGICIVLFLAYSLNEKILNPKDSNLKRVLSNLSIIKNQKQIRKDLFEIELFLSNIQILSKYILLLGIFCIFSIAPIIGYLTVSSGFSLMINLFISYFVQTLLIFLVFIIFVNASSYYNYYIDIKRFNFRILLRKYE